MTPEHLLPASAQPPSSPPNDDVGDVYVALAAWGSCPRVDPGRRTGPSKTSVSRIAARRGTSARTHTAPEGAET